MKKLDSKKKWASIGDVNELNGYRSLILDPACIPEIYVGLNDKKERSLILKLPNKFRLKCSPFDKEKLSLNYFIEKNYLVLSLHDIRFDELFDDLVHSLYFAIKDISAVEEYSREFLIVLSKWIQLFEDSTKNLLSEDQIQGLFGELCYLKSALLLVTDGDLNSVFESWKGPYDKGHDFVFPHKNIEIKTKLTGKVFVSISSEYQLDSIAGKEHHLLVNSIQKDIINGFSIKDLAIEIRDIAESQLVDFLPFLLALRQKNLTFSNIHEYDNFRYLLTKETVYDCLSEGFPKIVRSSLDTNISGVSYDLNLTNLKRYKISIKEF